MRSTWELFGGLPQKVFRTARDDTPSGALDCSLQCVACAHLLRGSAERPAAMRSARAGPAHGKEFAWLTSWTNGKASGDRKSVEKGKSGSDRVNLGGGRSIKQ